MPIPDFQTIMLPVLESVAQRKTAKPSEVVADVIAHFKLSRDEVDQWLKGGQRKIENRTYWALVYLAKAEVLTRPERGRYQVSKTGQSLLNQKPERVDIKLLMNFEPFRAFRSIGRNKNTMGDGAPEPAVRDAIEDPMEAIESGVEELRAAVIDELRRLIFEIDPGNFEKLVVRLLRKMGYGGPGLESVRHTGGPGDGGIDGEISQDPLGLDMIYVQAKRYADTSHVSRREVQEFAGSLNGRKATKGIFITSSRFSKDATEYLSQTSLRIIPIDGLRLAELLYDHELGVETLQEFSIKRVNRDFFEEL
jgi:restriction system protein